MVHRPADARLLSNLVSHEKDYSKSLNALLNASESSQGCLAAYAAASAPTTSRTILNVTAILAAADDAHARYAAAVEEWRDMLRGLHALEEEHGNVLRDREILVTRLIKASKNSKPSSHPRSPSTSSLNLRDSYRSLAPVSTKLAAAQSELQACETHLATKERELEVRRVQVIRDGLILRGRAMAETGRTWAQLGHDAIQAVEKEFGFDVGPEERDKPLPHETSSTLASHTTGSTGRIPPGGYPASSSEGSHSGSSHQVRKAGELRIPAAHAISSEVGMPIPLMGSHPIDSTSNSIHGPSVTSKRDSRPSSRIESIPAQSSLRDDTDQPQLLTVRQPRPQLHHVAPRARVSWVSVTDTEEDWVDAGEGGEELDRIFGTPRQQNGDPPKGSRLASNVVTIPKTPSQPSLHHVHTHPKPAPTLESDQNKDLPAPPPPLRVPAAYPFVSAPGSLFDSAEYKSSRDEASVAASRPISSYLASISRSRSQGSPAPEVTVTPAPVPTFATTSERDEEDFRNGDDTGSHGSGTTSVPVASELEFVGQATRHTFESDVPAVVATSPTTEEAPILPSPSPAPMQSDSTASESNLPPPLQPPALWTQQQNLSQGGPHLEPHAHDHDLGEERKEVVGEHESVPAVIREEGASLSTSGAPSGLPLGPIEDQQQQEGLPPSSSFSGTTHLLERRITEESSPWANPLLRQALHRQVKLSASGRRTARWKMGERKLGESSLFEDERGKRWKVVENPRFSQEAKPVGVPTEGTNVQDSQPKRRTSLKAAFLSPVSGPMVESSTGQPSAAHAVPVKAVTTSSTTTTEIAEAQVAAAQAAPLAPPPATSSIPPPILTSTAPIQGTHASKPNMFRRMFGKGRSPSMAKESVPETRAEGPPPPVPSAPPIQTTPAPAPAQAPTPLAAPILAPVHTAGEPPVGATTVSTTTTSGPVPIPSTAVEEPARVVEAREEVAVEAAPVPVLAPFPAPVPAATAPPPIVTSPAPASSPRKGKLSKRDRERTVSTHAGASPTKTHHHSSFLDGLKGFFGADLEEGKQSKKIKRKKGPTSATSGASESLEGLPLESQVPTATVWEPAPAQPQPSAPEGTKHHRQSSLRVLFGLNQPARSHTVPTGVPAGGNEADVEDGPEFRVVENDLDLERRRERLLEQHGWLAAQNAVGYAPRGAASPGKKVERRIIHRRSESVDAAPTRVHPQFHEEGGLVAARAPARLNVDELQAEAARAQSFLRPSSVAATPGWKTRTDRNLRQTDWADDEDIAGREKLLVMAGGGARRGQEMEFGPVVLSDGGPYRREPEVVDLGRGSGGGSKLKKGRSSSVPPAEVTSRFVPNQPQQHPAPQRQEETPSGGANVRRMGSTASRPGVIQQRRSTSLTSAPPAVAAIQQNQYGATVLPAGGDYPSGNLAKGGWGQAGGGASLGRNNSIQSAASAPAGSGTVNVVASSSMVDITRLNQATSKTARADRRTSVPYPIPGVPGVVTATTPFIGPPVGNEPLGANSLLSIVQDVARANREAEEQLRVLRSGGTMGKLDHHVMPAPVRVQREILTGAGPEPRPQAPMPAIPFTNTLPVSSSGGSTVGSSVGRRPSTQAMTPLKSALRDPNRARTPSPMGMQRNLAPSQPSALQQQVAHNPEDETDDEAYETPGDGLSGDEGVRSRKNSAVGAAANTSAPAPPPVQTATPHAGSTPVTQAQPLPSSSPPESTPQRRKSVRVSLQPTFSPSPPTRGYDDDWTYERKPPVPDKSTTRSTSLLGQGSASTSHASRATPRHQGGGGVRDMWADSDEEENEYTKAKSMLTRQKAEERHVYATAKAAAAAPIQARV
ncbi:hypothetical protein FA13DRAFT_1811030 [Coprinellus micaceus]|uniref:Uncharacterized protein n=1 Tax=Coprinellus micaceus TaxID=71717 RepID=A0A4Y7TN00_COPMI|nr:hypothetical protein FA13DRAFT_1811030 [Coprinellus micaceus]